MLPKRISEQDLILPALYCISESDEISTSDLTARLRALLNPQGEDLQTLSGRKDDKFSQKVRNLRSHETLERLGLVLHEKRGSQGYWTLTQKGKDDLEKARQSLEYLIGQRFEYGLQQEVLTRAINPEDATLEQLNLFDETIQEDDTLILEGRDRIMNQKVYERSMKLRASAINHYTVNGRIWCHACGFDFGLTYGSHGRGFIEIHHQKPIFSYGDEDIEKTLTEALRNVVPLCSNCHRMIHHSRNRMLSLEELKGIIDDSKRGNNP